MRANNATIFGIQDDAERYFWMAYLALVLISSLFGDTIILIASIRYHAFKLNKSIVAVLLHMAVCDIIISVTFVLPTIVSMFLNRWVLGKTLAKFHRFVEFWALPVCNVLVGVMTTSKYLLVRYPLQTSSWTSRKAHVTCYSIWFLFAAVSTVSLILCQDSLIFDYTSYEFDADYSLLTSNAGKYIDILISSTTFISVGIVVVSTVLTLRFLAKSRKISRRSSGSLRWQGVVTVLMTGLVYCLSVLPYALYTMMEHFLKDSTSSLIIELERSSEYLALLNVMANFYIYSLTVPSFRRFLRERCCFLRSGRSRIDNLSPPALADNQPKRLQLKSIVAK